MEKITRMKSVLTLTRSIKISLTASLVSLLTYISYITRGTYAILYGYFAKVPSDVAYVSFVGSAFWASYVGITARLIGVLLALTAVVLLWIKSSSFLRIRKLVVTGLFLEGVNFLTLTPSVWLLLNPKSPIYVPSLAYGYLLQILFTVPFLWALAYHIAKYREASQKPLLLKFGALAFVGYTAALVVNEVSRWVSMISLQSLGFISGIRGIGFFNALLLMPFSIVFAVAGAYRLFQQKERQTMRLFGAALSIIGLNYVIYLAYAYFVNALNTLPVVDIWTMPLLGLGITVILSPKDNPTNQSNAHMPIASQVLLRPQ